MVKSSKLNGALSVLMLCLFSWTQADRTKRQAKHLIGTPGELLQSSDEQLTQKIGQNDTAAASPFKRDHFNTLRSRMDRSCYRDMPTSELNECLRTNLQNSIPRFRSGIPGVYTGTLEPFYWPKFAHYFGRGLIQGSLVVRDINIWGMPALKVSAIRADVKDPQKLHVDMDWRVPKMDFFGHFKLKGKMGTVTFNGAGPFALNLTGVGGTWKVTGSREKDEPYMEITSFRGTPNIETLKLWAKGAALGNDRLNDLVLNTINRGWRIFHQIANPAVEREWGNFCKEKLNRVFLNVPYDEMFPLRKPSRG